MSGKMFQFDRVLASYSRILDKEKSQSHSKLPEVLHDESEHTGPHATTTTDQDEPVDDSWCLNFTKQSALFASFFFFTHIATGALIPYQALYQRQLGFNAKEIGYIGCAQPFIALLYNPIVGYITDKYSIRRYVLTGSLFGTAIANMALYFVPRIRTKDCADVLPSNGSASVTEHYLSAADVEKYSSSTSNDHSYIYNANDLQVVFIYLICMNMVAQLMDAPWFSLGGGVVLAALGPERRNHFGFFKGFGGIGNAIGVAGAGVALELTIYSFRYCFIDVEETNFMTIYLMFTGAMIVASPIAWMMSDEEEHTDDKIVKDATKTYSLSTFVRSICPIRYSSAIIVITWLSTVIGKMQTFDNWYIDVLGGSYLMMGWVGLVSKIVGIITFFCLPFLNDKIGHIPLLVFACVGVGAGCIVASFIESVTLMVVPLLLRQIATSIYAHFQGAFLGNAVEKQCQATLQSLMSALTFGIGRGLGSVLGGGLIEDLSPEMSYYIFAIVSFVMAVFLVLAQLLSRLLETRTKPAKI